MTIPSHPCTFEDIEYPSIYQAAKATGVSYNTMIRWVNAGYTSFADTPYNRRTGRRPVTWNGKHYNSITEAAKANNIRYMTLLGRIKRGWQCDDDVPPQGQYPVRVYWRDYWYPSIAEAARETGVSRQAVWSHMRTKKYRRELEEVGE